MTNTSIVDLFYAGLGPALVLVGLFAAYVLWQCRHMPKQARQMGRRAALRHSFGALIAPALVLGGIYSGYFTATEVAAVAVAYTLLL